MEEFPAQQTSKSEVFYIGGIKIIFAVAILIVIHRYLNYALFQDSVLRKAIFFIAVISFSVMSGAFFIAGVSQFLKARSMRTLPINQPEEFNETIRNVVLFIVYTGFVLYIVLF